MVVLGKFQDFNSLSSNVFSVISTDTLEKCSIYQTGLKCIYQMVCFENNGLVASGTNGIELLKLTPKGHIEFIKKICNEDINASVIANKKLYSGGSKGKLFVHDLAGSLLCEVEPHSEAIQW